MALNNVLGAGFNGTHVSVTMGTEIIRCMSMSYGDGEDAVVTMSATVFRTDFVKLLNAPPFPIVVNRQRPELGDDSDMLSGCSVERVRARAQSGEDPEYVEVTFAVEKVMWTDARIMVGATKASDV